MKVLLKELPYPELRLGPLSTPFEWTRGLTETYNSFRLHGYEIRGRTLDVEEVHFVVMDKDEKKWTFTLLQLEDGCIHVKEDGVERDLWELAIRLARQRVIPVSVGLTLNASRKPIDIILWVMESIKDLFNNNKKDYVVVKEKIMKDKWKVICLCLIVFGVAGIMYSAVARIHDNCGWISELEQELREVAATAALNEAKIDHLLEGTELSRKLKEPTGEEPVKVVNITLTDTVLMELRDAINHYLKVRRIEQEAEQTNTGTPGNLP